MSAKKYTGYYTYRMWLGFSRHFTTEGFDIRKYPVAACNYTTFERSKVRFAFEWLSNKYDASRMRTVMLANFVQGYEDETYDTWWVLDRERVQRAYKNYSQKIRHFRHVTLTNDGYDLIMGGRVPLEERFEIWRQKSISTESFLISCRGTNDLKKLKATYGETDSFPNYSEEVIFLRKYDLLLDLIPPIEEIIHEKGITGRRVNPTS